MRPPFDIRFSRSALALIAIVSAVATFVILHGGERRSPAQLAALVALRDRPRPRPAASVAAATGSATTSAASGGSGGSTDSGGSGAGGFSGGSGGGSGTGAGSSLPPGTSVPSSTPASSPATSTTTPSGGSPGGDGAKKKKSDLPVVKHVFEIMLSAPRYASAFGHGSKLTVLHKLIRKGTLLSDYRSLGAGELADELAAVSGQAPNGETRRGCTSYVDFPTAAVANKAGIVPGRGCVYPETALTIGDEVTATGATWGAYVAGMGKETCLHPNSGAVDDTLPTGAQAGYDTRHNPFIYFHSLLDLGDCASDDVDLGRLTGVLDKPAKTPAFAYVAPDACADGDPTEATSTTATAAPPTTSSSTTPASTTPVTTPSSTTASSTTPASTTSSSTTTTGTTSTATTPAAPAAAPAGCPSPAPSGLAAENAFLRTWVPRILHSGAYRHDGVLVIAFTRSGTASGHPARSGALILSPLARRDARIASPQNPYSLLRLDEDALGLSPLAHARHAKGLAAKVLGHAQG